jgi:quercetin dioxygenase-like cupin family protein
MELVTKTGSNKGPADWFTGDVYFDVIVPTDGRAQGRCNAVHFTPGAHTAWHRHANGQLLHVTEGIGLTQSCGGEVVVIRPGDTAWCPPGEWHWHGAAPDHFMTHLAIWDSLTEGQEGVETEWGDHLTDDEYQMPSGA